MANISEIFIRKIKGKDGKVIDEVPWVVVKRKSGKIVKKLSFKNYRMTRMPDPINLDSPVFKKLVKAKLAEPA